MLVVLFADVVIGRDRVDGYVFNPGGCLALSEWTIMIDIPLF
jgi:hypothetical protein